ncbi:HEAT repeat domain-containing protein [Thermoflexibacter ruber]|uniref:HEAT repeat-containing protein n=1 Tax=Thermoflexibacter ruber TaxID=1003 RepID=A0A1I2D6D8_9BACT|nr:HEAT repeat domain-containing protein [Thermoflexibacter ruber]SFE75643.1 HEAT repeat-containing protein [Thermoflexibacter ruber]
MNCEEIKIHLIDLIDNNLPTELQKEVEEGLANCPDCQQEYEELKILFQTFQNQPLVPTPKALDDNFYAFLEKEKAVERLSKSFMEIISEDTDNGKVDRVDGTSDLQKAKTFTFASVFTRKASLLRIAASIALLIATFFFGRQSVTEQNSEAIALLKQEIANTKNLVMLNMLKQASASDRIKAVSYVYEMEDADKETIDALVNVMNYDKSINVRLEAINALYYFGDKKEVRQAMTKSLRLQTEPNLQIALIETLVRLKEKEAVNEIQKLMENKQLPDIVKFKAAEGVGELYKL